jgi:hypothetical protein
MKHNREYNNKRINIIDYNNKYTSNTIKYYITLPIIIIFLLIIILYKLLY